MRALRLRPGRLGFARGIRRLRARGGSCRRRSPVVADSPLDVLLQKESPKAGPPDILALIRNLPTLGKSDIPSHGVRGDVIWVNAGADFIHMKVVTKPFQHPSTRLGGETLALKRNTDYPGQIGLTLLDACLDITHDCWSSFSRKVQFSHSSSPSGERRDTRRRIFARRSSAVSGGWPSVKTWISGSFSSSKSASLSPSTIGAISSRSVSRVQSASQGTLSSGTPSAPTPRMAIEGNDRRGRRGLPATCPAGSSISCLCAFPAANAVDATAGGPGSRSSEGIDLRRAAISGRRVGGVC